MKMILTFIFCIFNFSFSIAQWESCNNGIYGGNVKSISTNNDSIYAGTYLGGLYLSTNFGEKWTQIYIDLKNYYIKSMLFSGSSIFIATNGGGIYTTSDNGKNWTPKNMGLTDTIILSMAQSGNCIFAGSYYKGVFLTTDNGNNWVKRSFGLYSNRIYSLLLHSNNLIAGTAKGVYMSSDSGRNWVPKYSGIQDLDIFSLATIGNNLVAGTYYGIYLSTNEGNSWTLRKSPITQIVSFASIGNNIFAATKDSGIYISKDSGNTWTSSNFGLKSYYINSLSIIGNNLIAGTISGVFFSTDMGNTWFDNNTGITCAAISDFIDNGKYIFVSNGSGIFRSSDYGVTWEVTNSGLTSIDITALASNGGIIYAGDYYANIFYSSNNGDTWNKIFSQEIFNVPYINLKFISALAVIDSNIIAATYDGLVISTDNGKTWPISNMRLTDEWIHLLMVKDYKIFACSGSGNLFISRNNGIDWAIKLPKNSLNSIGSLIVTQDSIFAGYNGYYMDQEGYHSGYIKYSTNDGRTWDEYHTTINDLSVNAMQFIGDNLVIGTQKGIYISKENQSKCNSIDSGLAGSFITLLRIKGDYIYAGTLGNGLFRSKLSNINYSAVKDDLDNGNKFNIYPNPAGHFIVIKNHGFNVSKISICNLIGEEVLKMTKASANDMEVIINISSLPSGGYLINIDNHIEMFIKE